MEKKNSVLGLGIIVVLLLIFGVGFLSLGVFNMSSVASAGLGSSEKTSTGYTGQYGGDYYNPGPAYHVFNFFNSGALSWMLFIGIIITLGMVYSLYDKTESLLASMLYIIGTLLLFSSATILLFGIHDLVNFSGQGETFKKPTVMQQYGWIIESVVFGALGAAFVWSAESIRRRNSETGSLAYLAATPVASLLVLFALPIFFFGLHGTIFNDYGKPSFAWTIETVIFGGIGALAFNWVDKSRAGNGEKGLWKEYPLFAAGYGFLLPAAVLFIFGVLNYMENQYALEPWKPFVESAILAPLGLAALYIIDRLHRKGGEIRTAMPGALSLVGGIFLVAASFSLVIGFSAWLRADITASNYRTAFAWVVDVIIFSLMGYATLLLSDRMKSPAGEERKALPKVISVCGFIVWVAALFFYGLAVGSFVFDKSPEAKFAVEFLAYGAIGIGLAAYSDMLREREGFPKNRVVPKLLAYSGGLLLLVALLAFVFDLHGFLYSENPEAKWVLRVLGYGIAGAVLLAIGNLMEPIMPKKGSKGAGKLANFGEGAPIAKPAQPEKPPEEPKKKKARQEIIHEAHEE